MNAIAVVKSAKPATDTFFSLCIPTYERCLELERCLESVKNQTYKDFEVIISDDSISLDVMNLIENYKNQIEIKYNKNKLRLGVPSNWNNCIKLAQGKYINLLHQDDYFSTKDALEIIHEKIISNSRNKIFVTDLVLKEMSGFKERKITDDQIQLINKEANIFYLGNLVGPPSVVIISRDLKYIKYNNNLKWFVDTEYYSRLMKKSSVTHIKESLYTIDAGNSGRLTQEVQDNKELLAREHFIFFMQLNISKNYLKYLIYFFRSTKCIDEAIFKNIKDTLMLNQGPKVFIFLLFLKFSFYYYKTKMFKQKLKKRL